MDLARPLVITHGNCIDGLGAAWAAWNFFGMDCDIHPGQYGKPPPDVTNRVVYIVDFSYPIATLQEMRMRAKGIMVLDHHKTAQHDLAGVLVPIGLNYHDYIPTPLGLSALFDMERSGAGITWDFFYPGKPRPRLLDHIEDRDLWRFKIPGSREIHACIASYPVDDIENFDALVDRCSEQQGYDAMISEGAGIDRRHLQMVRENIKTCTRRMNFGGYNVPVCNAPYAFASDTGNILCEGEPFAGTYLDTAHGRQFSLRSSDKGVDVSAIAKHYGGGGHRNASGFAAVPGWEGEP